jgi:hypothetical protein
MQQWLMGPRNKTAATGQNQSKGLRHKKVTVSWEQEDLQTAHHETRRWIFCRVTENAELEALTPSGIKIQDMVIWGESAPSN